MKFTKGYWQKREGVQALHPVELHSAEARAGSLTVTAATRPLTGRVDTLDTALVTVRCSSPMADVIRVEISHFRGGRRTQPEFHLHSEPVVVEVARSEEHTSELQSRI